MWGGGVGSVGRVREEYGRQGFENPLEPMKGKGSEIN